MKKTAIIALALAGLMLLAGCAGNNSGNENESSSAAPSSYSANNDESSDITSPFAKNDGYSSGTSSYYSAEYLEFIKNKLSEYSEEIQLSDIGIDGQKHMVNVTLMDPSPDIMNKIEEIIGKEGMDACNFNFYEETPYAELC